MRWAYNHWELEGYPQFRPQIFRWKTLAFWHVKKKHQVLLLKNHSWSIAISHSQNGPSTLHLQNSIVMHSIKESNKTQKVAAKLKERNVIVSKVVSAQIEPCRRRGRPTWVNEVVVAAAPTSHGLRVEDETTYHKACKLGGKRWVPFGQKGRWWGRIGRSSTLVIASRVGRALQHTLSPFFKHRRTLIYRYVHF